MSYFSSDTIAAIATSVASDAGVGIIRVSGKDALKAVQCVTRGLENPKPRYLHRIEVLDPVSKHILDDGLGVFFEKGKSFTGEEVIELQLHGGRFLLQTVLKSLLETQKVRAALPGEFSFRAVRNGKLSLTNAEALQQLIAAQSGLELQLARKSLSQKRREEFDKIGSKIRHLLAQTELSIDFIDQDVEVISAQNMLDELESLCSETAKLLNQLKLSRRLAKGIQVSLVGEPNAGKSTLFNAILAEDRAIVSPEAGTTRDVITEMFNLGLYPIRLADTAGLRETLGLVEKEGISRAIELVQSSDLVIFVLDSTKKDKELPHFESKQLLIALNKWDLLDSNAQQEQVKFFSDKYGKDNVISLSALSSEGVSLLLEKMESKLNQVYGECFDSFLPSEFQLEMLMECKSTLEEAKNTVKAVGLNQPELVSAQLQGAVGALSQLLGETTPDTILTKIFSEFCIGK